MACSRYYFLIQFRNQTLQLVKMEQKVMYLAMASARQISPFSPRFCRIGRATRHHIALSPARPQRLRSSPPPETPKASRPRVRKDNLKLSPRLPYRKQSSPRANEKYHSQRPECVLELAVMPVAFLVRVALLLAGAGALHICHHVRHLFPLSTLFFSSSSANTSCFTLPRCVPVGTVLNVLFTSTTFFYLCS